MMVVKTRNADSDAAVVFVCEHASNHVPAGYQDLGLDQATLLSHIAWDPGALSVAELLADHFSAPLVTAQVSRLLYDCNRPPEAADAIPERSEVYDVPGNAGLSSAERRARVEEIYTPFSNALTGLLDDRDQRGVRGVLITIHSFTPTYRGEARSVELGVLHDSDSRLADAMLDLAAAVTGLVCARNEPYGPENGVTHTLCTHGLKRGLPNVMLEIRNDLLSDRAQAEEVTGKLARLIELSLAALSD